MKLECEVNKKRTPTLPMLWSKQIMSENIDILLQGIEAFVLSFLLEDWIVY